MYSYCISFCFCLFSFVHRAQDFYHSELEILQCLCCAVAKRKMSVMSSPKYVGALNQPRKCAKQIKNDALDLITVRLFFLEIAERLHDS